MRLRPLLFVAALSASAYAQPDVRDHRKPPIDVHAHVGVTLGGEPTEAPPAPREEKVEARAGFVWAAGQWDWRDGKWQWTPGHWERERAGKHWRAGRWENEGGHWKRVEGGWDEGAGVAVATPPVPPLPTDGPTEAPPPPRPEKVEARAGFVWIAGQWDWRGGKYEWTPGHWERERAGKKWREARWEQRDGRWQRSDGDWVDASGQVGATDPLPPNGNPGVVPPDVRDHHHHDWKLERPTVSSYWPVKGKAGTKVTIRGVYFPQDASVLFNGKKVLGALVTPEKIQFMIPNDAAATGEIAIDRGRGRPLQVGTFEVAAGFDAVAEQARLDDERRKAAEAQWADQQKRWAKDRAAREAEFHKHEQELETTREQRREQREQELRAKWNAAFLADADTQDELTMHAQRVAQLERMKEVAQLSADTKIGVRVDVATQRENDRHQQRMAALQAAFQAKGGAQ
jgi:hypothetical protein